MRKNIFKYGIVVVVFILVLVLFICHNSSSVDFVEEVLDDIEVEVADEVSSPLKIKVDVKGEVVNPGVYELDFGSRVVDAIDISGGMTSQADTNLINLSKSLTDEMVIVVYSKDYIASLKENKEPIKIIEYIEKECHCPDTINDACVSDTIVNDNDDSSNDGALESNNLVNINKASVLELTKLTGIGEAKAKAIVKYREENGLFQTIDDIMNVTGIGESLFEKFKGDITI